MDATASEKVNLSKYIELRDNRPNLRGRRLSVAFIASAERANKLSIAELAYEFTLTEEQVLAALLYYREHQTEIDAQDAADAAQSQEMNVHYRQNQ